METNLVFYSSSKSELKGIIAEALKEELSSFFSKESKSDSRLRTRKEVAEMLSISLPTLNTWTKEGIIKTSRINNSVRYNMEDIEQALQNVQSTKYMRGRTINNSQL